ncbi:RNA polymerase II transcriptional coactivator KELP-like isoform X3 [Zingiber officinale]|uniref:RNA polymerase II transcriptional coactivator KELP-like isoform X3 n=1 Tax=Zingiber officinale TaxID=94328 RepID=UPI001C4B7082|nr:RNA polymerase II transcriptional coactivator KELP-like isoform X3 [Zingiber officinale]
MEEEELNRKIEAAVVEILRESDMSSTSESMVRSMASKRLGLDLSSGVRKLFVRGIVESFLDSQQTEDEEAVGDFPAIRLKGEEEESAEQPAADREEEAEGVCSTARSRRRPNEYDDEGDLSLCRLPNKRRVTLQDFKGKTLVSIREYYLKDGEELPSSKGISLTIEQRQAFQNAVPNITAAIKKLGRFRLKVLRSQVFDCLMSLK